MVSSLNSQLTKKKIVKKEHPYLAKIYLKLVGFLKVLNVLSTLLISFFGICVWLNYYYMQYSFLIGFRPFEFQVVILLECFDTLHVYWNCLLFLIKILLLTLGKKIIIAFVHELSLELDFEAPCGSWDLDTKSWYFIISFRAWLSVLFGS